MGCRVHGVTMAWRTRGLQSPRGHKSQTRLSDFRFQPSLALSLERKREGTVDDRQGDSVLYFLNRSFQTWGKRKPFAVSLEAVPGVSRSCCGSVAQSCPTLCDPVDRSTPGFPVLQYFLEFAQTHVH